MRDEEVTAESLALQVSDGLLFERTDARVRWWFGLFRSSMGIVVVVGVP
jgi:hypothetical protein